MLGWLHAQFVPKSSLSDIPTDAFWCKQNSHHLPDKELHDVLHNTSQRVSARFPACCVLSLQRISSLLSRASIRQYRSRVIQSLTNCSSGVAKFFFMVDRKVFTFCRSILFYEYTKNVNNNLWLLISPLSPAMVFSNLPLWRPHRIT